jgi:hypothetical protein
MSRHRGPFQIRSAACFCVREKKKVRPALKKKLAAHKYRGRVGFHEIVRRSQAQNAPPARRSDRRRRSARACPDRCKSPSASALMMQSRWKCIRASGYPRFRCPTMCAASEWRCSGSGSDWLIRDQQRQQSDQRLASTRVSSRSGHPAATQSGSRASSAAADRATRTIFGSFSHGARPARPAILTVSLFRHHHAVHRAGNERRWRMQAGIDPIKVASEALETNLRYRRSASGRLSSFANSLLPVIGSAAVRWPSVGL